MKLYPKHYQEEFAEERREVFTLALAESASFGRQKLLLLMLRELCDFPLSLIKMHLREWVCGACA